MYELEIAYRVAVKLFTILTPCIIGGVISASIVIILMKEK